MVETQGYQNSTQKCIKKINENNTNQEPSYKFFIAGHAYGNPFDKTSTELNPKFDRTKYDKSGEGIRRQTFEYKEWQSFTTAMRSYCAKVKLKLADEEYFERELIRHYFLFAANSRLRSGELK